MPMKPISLDPRNEVTYVATPSPEKAKSRIGQSTYRPTPASAADVGKFLSEWRSKAKKRSQGPRPGGSEVRG